ncbi:MAG: PhoU domain-containing protein, partial [Candidatus Jordarchaeaceae archaeon]
MKEALKNEKRKIRLHYRDQLKNLENLVAKMMESAIGTVRDSVESLKNQDVKLAEKVLETAKKIDDLE